MANVRAAFQCQRHARRYRGLWLFHCEFRQPEAAANARILMLDALRAACHEWRLALGLGGPPGPRRMLSFPGMMLVVPVARRLTLARW
ncbi:MAG: hypothetical protein IPK26_03225 [Planctomycetes bacterium]|nr:hypothetical protein [Planctomycetota bacterium]